MKHRPGGPSALAPAMREALLWLRADGAEQRCSDRAVSQRLARLRDLGLCAYLAGRERCAWRITELGRTWRAALEPRGRRTPSLARVATE
jgi:hypothetical protein